MTDNKKKMDRTEIVRLLRKLDDDLVHHGQQATIYIVGGANIALAVSDSRVTTDIDVVVKNGFDVVFQAAERVAADEPGLGADWLNAQFTGNAEAGGLTWPWIDNKDQDAPSRFFNGRGLIVELASPEMMLALKTLAQRQQDLKDMYQLMRMTGIKTPLQLGQNLARFTGRRIFDAQRTPGMFIHIDPDFRNVFDNAPDDLKPPPGTHRVAESTRDRSMRDFAKRLLERPPARDRRPGDDRAL